MADTFIQDENVIESAPRGSIFNCVIDPSGTPLERSIAHEDVVLDYWAMMSFSEGTTGPSTLAISSGIPFKLAMFDTAVSTADMTVTVGGSPLDSKITIVKTGWYMFTTTVAMDMVHGGNPIVDLYMYWNGSAFAKQTHYHWSSVDLHSRAIAPFLFEVTSASKDFEIYVESTRDSTAEFWDGHASVKRMQ